MKSFILLALLLPACSLFTPVAKSPCDGLYCLGVEVTSVPGAALICYETEEQRSAARVRFAQQGCALGVDAQQRQRAVCPRAVTP